MLILLIPETLSVDERIHSLETSLIRLSEQVNGMRDEVYGLNKALYTKEPPIPINKLRPNQASPTTSAFPTSSTSASRTAHIRNGSAHLVHSDASPGASPLNSPVRTTHEALQHAANSEAPLAAAPTTSSGAGGLAHSASLRRRANNYFGTSSAAHHHNNGLLSADGNAVETLPVSPGTGASSLPSSSNGIINNTAEPPTPTAASYLQQSANLNTGNNNGDPSDAGLPQSAAMTSSNRMIDGAIQIGSGTHATYDSQLQRPATAQAMSTSPGGTTLTLPNRPSTSASAEGSTASTSASSSLANALMTPSSSTSTTAGTGSSSSEKKGGSSSSSSADNPYKSFRVTLEDPCYKVLPAALKKYKINDDWRQYALFICYDNQGECPRGA